MADCKTKRGVDHPKAEVGDYARYAKFYIPLYLHELESEGKLKVGEKKLT